MSSLVTNGSLLNTDIVTNSFYITYVILFTTGTITFIEALRTSSPMIRHIMNLETCISIVAAFFYSKFIEMRNKAQLEGSDMTEINTVRYTDWAITTPMMLLVLGLALTYNHNTKFSFLAYVIMVVLNFGMLLSGYLGETGRMERNKSMIIGFVFFIVLVAYAWSALMAGHSTHTANMIIFVLFFAIWTLYGVVANFGPVAKNVSYNILDVCAKCFMGIGFWAYFIGLFK